MGALQVRRDIIPLERHGGPTLDKALLARQRFGALDLTTNGLARPVLAAFGEVQAEAVPGPGSYIGVSAVVAQVALSDHAPNLPLDKPIRLALIHSVSLRCRARKRLKVAGSGSFSRPSAMRTIWS